MNNATYICNGRVLRATPQRIKRLRDRQSQQPSTVQAMKNECITNPHKAAISTYMIYNASREELAICRQMKDAKDRGDTETYNTLEHKLRHIVLKHSKADMAAIKQVYH